MSYTSLNHHIVFSTKERRPFLKADTMSRLVPYLGGIIRDDGGTMLKANGPADHIHVIVTLPATLALADVLRTVKSVSSKWIHGTFPRLKAFAWQDGYAAFSVSRSVLPKVVRYVADQAEHHRKMSFTEELVALLKKHGIAYDERYLA